MITTDSGKQVEALTPIITSTNRPVGIPALYTKWSFNRLAKEHCIWYSPSNRWKMHVSSKWCKVVVFQTKNPELILPYLYELDRRGTHYCFQFTLNDYVSEGFEPNMPGVTQRVEIFRELPEVIRKKQVIWRFDPLIMIPPITPRVLLSCAWEIGNLLKGYTDKLMFSFIGIKAYCKVQNNLIEEANCSTKEDVETAEMNTAQYQETVEGLVKLRETWASTDWNVTLATCAEDIDLMVYGIRHNQRVGDGLMERVFEEDYELVCYLRIGQLLEPDLSDTFPALPDKRRNLKDRGQRKACGCVVSRDIGRYNTCRHFCIYYYANASREYVQKNAVHCSDGSESLIRS